MLVVNNMNNIKEVLEQYNLSDIKSFSVDKTQKTINLHINDKIIAINYADKQELLKDMNKFQVYLENKFNLENETLNAKIMNTCQERLEIRNNCAKNNFIISLILDIFNLLSIPLFLNFYFSGFLVFVLAVDVSALTILLTNTKIRNKKENMVLAKKKALEKSRQENINNFKKMVTSLKQVVLKVKYSEKEVPNDEVDFALSMENHFNKEKILHFTR